MRRWPRPIFVDLAWIFGSSFSGQRVDLDQIAPSRTAPLRSARSRIAPVRLLSRSRPPRLDTPRPQRVKPRLLRKAEQARTGQNLWAAATETNISRASARA